MALFFSPPVDTITARTSPTPHPMNRLLRHYRPYQRSSTVYVYSGVATTTPPPTADTPVRVFAGGHLNEPVTAAEQSALEAAGYDVADTDVLLGDAVVMLRAPDVYSPGDPWVNSGTGGAGFDAEVGDTQPTLDGGSFLVESGVPGPELSGWEIADDDLWAPDVNTDSVTYVHDCQPLESPATKMVWHYHEANLPADDQGWVSEMLDISYPVLAWVWAAANPTHPTTMAPAAATHGPYSLARHVFAVRVDAAADRLTTFVDGEATGVFDTAAAGSIAAAGVTPLRFGDHCRHWAFGAWERALSDTEVYAISRRGVL